MKKMVCFICIVFSFFFIFGCQKANIKEENIKFKDLKNPKIIAEDKNYKIYSSDNSLSYYYIYDNIGNIVKEYGFNNRIPEISLINDDILKFRMQTGTGIGTGWNFYYDTKNNIISDTYYAVTDEYNDLVMYFDKEKIIVQNIFDKSKFYTEITKLEKVLSQEAVEPFINAEFISKKKILVTYLTNENNEFSETINIDN